MPLVNAFATPSITASAVGSSSAATRDAKSSSHAEGTGELRMSNADMDRLAARVASMVAVVGTPGVPGSTVATPHGEARRISAAEEDEAPPEYTRS